MSVAEILLALQVLFLRPVADPAQVAQAIRDFCPGRELLVVAAIRIESPRLDPRAISSAGALGLMQILCRPNFKRPYCKDPGKLLQIRENIKHGCHLLGELAKIHARCSPSQTPWHHLIRHWNWYGPYYQGKVLCALAGVTRAVTGVDPHKVRAEVRACLVKLRSKNGSRASPPRASHPP